MDTRKEVGKEAVRAALQALGKGGKEISYHLVYEALGLKSEAEQAVVRSRISDMTRHGEVKRTRTGCFTYDFKHRPREAKSYETLWRFVRKAKPGWSVSECAMYTRVSYTQALRYCNWLEEEGFIERAGRSDRNAVTWRPTVKADQNPETPYPPLRETDPFAKERVAAATITRLMLCANPYALKTARDITDACRVLLARFEKDVPENRTENENEEDCHVE
ncbi:hypothetical protein [uncultured Desulfovibrio sp.]|uniref:hypothetical protein n=1 Tax=uncultured Desulfovibrio sp. TaxID=167968 RepID=UPI0025E18ED9|nr:hypothetical protein [uncultured Desulfovibrio sp.]